MSTALPETVTTTTTTAVKSQEQKSQHTESMEHKEPREALDMLGGPSLSERAAVVAKSAAAAMSNAAQQVGVAAQHAATAISEKAHDVDTKYHLTDKAKDAAAHMGSALKQGNPAHAVKHAGTAAAIGEAERNKHSAGPLPEGAHSAEAGVGSVTQASTISATGPSSTSSGATLGTQASDAASFASAALSAGHPVHAAQYAATAAKIGEAERNKHAAGNLENEKDIQTITGSK